MTLPMQGIWNQFLTIDLNTLTHDTWQPPPEYYTRYLGGKAMAGKLLNDLRLFDVDPLSPGNVLMIMVGPASGTQFPGAAKAIVATRSPLTGIYLDSAVGGRLSNAVKRNGYDGIIIKGRAERPSYLLIQNGKLEILPADGLWGLNAFETETRLRQQLGWKGKGAVLSIGPAGENMVSFACCTSDWYHQAGRGGAGAVLGSKNIKAIAAFGQCRVPVANPPAFQTGCAEWMRKARQSERVIFRSKYGTLTTLDMTQKLGIVPVRNFQDGVYDGYQAVNAVRIQEEYVIDNLTCMGCPMPCGKHTRYKWQDQTEEIGGPEYETLALMGANLGIDSLEGIAHLNYLCDDLGMDTISSGNVLGCAIEAYETGQINQRHTGGLELKWGDVATMETLLRQIAHCQGFGADLAVGVRGFSEKYNLDPGMAIHVKGMELPGYDPRGTIGYALAYAIADRGACHRRARPIMAESKSEALRFSYQGKAEMVKSQEDGRGFEHSMVLCDYVPTFFEMKPADLATLMTDLTGIEFTPEKLMRVGERAISLARLFNNHCGITSLEDTLPKRFFKQAMHRGSSAGKTIDPAGLETMVHEYYALRGWDVNGQVPETTLRALEID